MRLALVLITATLQAQVYDLVIRNGRVMDPESGLDAVRAVAVLGGKIAAVSTGPLEGRVAINATGLVVSPGFIDIHSHGQTPENYAFKARDGVTSALEMEVGVNPVAPWYAAREGKSLINFGASSGQIPSRMAVLGDTGTFLPRDKAVTGMALAEQQAVILKRVRQGLDDGAMGVGLGIAYMPLATRLEILDLFRVAAEFHTAVYVHMRNAGPIEPGVIDALQEVLSDAAITGAALHVVHLPSMAFRQTPECLLMIAGARRHALDVTTEAYPYTAGMTWLETAIFDPGWQERLGIGFGGLQWVATGERLTAQTFEKYRKEGGDVILHHIPEEIVRLAMADPTVLIASDGWIDNGKGHPRGAGSYARVLARYVREQHVLPLMTALAKMTLLPAQRLDLPDKGRIKVGADADLTLFDPARVADRATYENPAQYSDGIPYVIVNGVPVVSEGKLQPVAPGRGIRRIRRTAGPGA
ncbi:MAG: amidohydrolase family protein [Acidobacteriota bacterium]|nr:amidohydrolase family protein [Acidobacteriota bacterium]